MLDFQDKVVMVTGAAGNLGSAVVQAYREAGAHLILVDYKEDRLQHTYPELAQSRQHFLAQGIDLTRAESVKDMAGEAVDRLGQVDALVHTVGGFAMGDRVHELDSDTWQGMLELNALTFLYISQAVVPHMLDRGSGKIVSIGARPSLGGKAKMGAYSVAKSAVLRLTESMSAELKSQGINVNCVLPGTIDTPGNREAMPDADYTKWVQPQSLADTILFLTSRAARDIHGVALPVYGS